MYESGKGDLTIISCGAYQETGDEKGRKIPGGLPFDASRV
jgi:hypothetical protein